MAKQKQKRKRTMHQSRIRCAKCGLIGTHNIDCPRNIANQKWHGGESILGRNWRNQMV